MRVVILGGTGNISSGIVKQLLEKGYNVICYNRGNSDSTPKGARQIVGDRNDRDAFELVMQKEKFDMAIDMISFNAEDAASSIAAFRGVKHLGLSSFLCKPPGYLIL
jgi:nucleoside-diphosphate-sugar epimerase